MSNQPRTHAALYATFCVCSTLFAAPAFADVGPEAKAAIELACKMPKGFNGWQNVGSIVDEKNPNKEWIAIDPSRVFYFAGTQIGLMMNEMTPIERVRMGFTNSETPGSNAEDDKLANIIRDIQGNLADKKLPAFKAYDLSGHELVEVDPSQSRLWLDKARFFRCQRDRADIPEVESSSLTFAVRETAEELALKGEKRDRAGSAKFSVVRERTYESDGNRKQMTNVNIKGAAGIGIFDNADQQLYLYSSYEFARSRSKPVVLPTPPAKIGDDDTEIIKLGVIARSYFDLDSDRLTNDSALSVSVTGAYLFDRIRQSERVQSLITVRPFVYNGIGGICGISRPLPTFIPGVRGVCNFDGLFQVNHVTKKGKLSALVKDNFVLAGGRIQYGLELASNLDAGLFANGSFEYQKSLYGGVPDVKRHSVSLKYRQWFDKKFALDWGVELVDGINPDSFADENKLSLAVGVVF